MDCSEKFEDAKFDWLKTVVVIVENLFGFVEIDAVAGFFAPGNLRNR